MGFITITTHQTPLHFSSSGLIDEIVVSRAYRGEGIGKMLIGAAIEKFKQLGCCEIEVSSEFKNTTVKRFYKNCGFEEKGVILEKDL